MVPVHKLVETSMMIVPHRIVMLICVNVITIVMKELNIDLVATMLIVLKVTTTTKEANIVIATVAHDVTDIITMIGMIILKARSALA